VQETRKIEREEVVRETKKEVNENHKKKVDDIKATLPTYKKETIRKCLEMC
jgi:hypothetical protein